MPRTAVRRLHRDWPLLLILGFQLIAIGAYLGSSAGQGGEGQGWRRIDTAEVRERVESGRLSGHEALWYHVGKD